MAQDDLLSQEEIDALLKGVSGEDEGASGSQAGGSGTRVRPYDPATQHRVVRERLHALDIINERFARYFRMAIFNFLRRSADITVDTVRYLSYSEFSRNVPVPTNINIISMKPLKGSALIVFPPNLVFMVVDNLFGGDGRFLTRSEGREFTNTEQRIIQRMLQLAIDAYSESWRSIYPLEISYVRSEMQSKFANITNSPNEIVVNTSFNIDVGHLSSSFQICIPFAMIEPLRDLLSNPLKDGDQDPDNLWGRRMAGELRQSQIELVADLTSIPSRINQVLSLKIGDILPMELPDTVLTSVDGIPVMECEYGSQNQHRALRVVRMIDHAKQHEPLEAEDAFLKKPSRSQQQRPKEANHD
ncbi:flagellar motor switch protein FliM [Halochromatium salexigens]|uniref:Flagellar motor switch protein FliM n=1 Tax=Halochromatium salexigens TaxID=49447 RepID=A0AAJ0XEG5_HALSE|nr:flagellar motor switch protein FliM [Halochromatium salexigens]MBK5929789.1 flagellar motor switch protein FliM [Halochromatium salexigens]